MYIDRLVHNFFFFFLVKKTVYLLLQNLVGNIKFGCMLELTFFLANNCLVPARFVVRHMYHRMPMYILKYFRF